MDKLTLVDWIISIPLYTLIISSVPSDKKWIVAIALLVISVWKYAKGQLDK
jgi:hypothetical protein